MNEARFGENFNPDHASRVNVLDQEQKVPEYVEFGRRIRSLLKGQDQETGEIKTNWPECPHGLTDLEDFFNAAKGAVSQEWGKQVDGVLQGKYQEWLQQIPETEDNQPVIDLLHNTEQIEKNLKIQQLGELEGIRTTLPEAWRTLVMVSSERQLATLSVLRHWLKNDLNDEDLTKLGLSRPEMEIMLDAGGVLGKYIDHAYVKQIELADQPSGTAKSKLGQRQGAEYVYDLYQSPHGNKTTLMSFSEVFAGEWPKIVNGLKSLAKKIEGMIKDGTLTDNYKGLPDYIETLVNLYDSKETSPEKLQEIWEALNIKMNQLAASGCPLMIIPGLSVGVTGDANKIDVDLRLGFRTEGVKKLEESVEEFRQITQRLDEHYQDHLGGSFTVPKMTFNLQPLAFGGNLQLFTIAETGVERIVSHVNASNELAEVNHYPIMRQLFPEKFSALNKSEYLMAVNLDTALHELGHNVLPSENPSVFKRLGASTEAIILDEIKAETVSLFLLREKLKTLDVAPARELAERQFFAKLVGMLDYVANNSSEKGSDGEHYFYPGLVILERLMDKGVLIKQGDKYAVTDPQQGIEVIADLGQEVLDNYYLNPKATPQDARRYIRNLRSKKDEIRIKGLREQIKKGS